MAMMAGGAVLVVLLGSRRLPPSVVWRRNADGGRIDFFNLELDPTVRHTVWSVVAGNYFYWLAACSVNQAMVQRCLSLPSVRQANVAVIILAVGISLLVSISCYTGLLIYAHYEDCDPVSAGRIGKADQLVPLFVMEVAGALPGLPGIFMAGVFSAALSTMSTGLNSMSGVIYEDLVRPRLRRPLSEANASRFMKGVVLVIGVICTALVFAVEKLGTLIQAGKSLGAITAGPLLGMFSLGMLFPSSNAKGAVWGGVTSLLLVGWISVNSQAAIAQCRLLFPKKPVSVSGCTGTFNRTLGGCHPSLAAERMAGGEEGVAPLYRLSYMLYTLLGAATAVLVGLAVSRISGGNDVGRMNPKLFAPWIQRRIARERSGGGGKKKVVEAEHKF